jgi:hypothetical protein
MFGAGVSGAAATVEEERSEIDAEVMTVAGAAGAVCEELALGCAVEASSDENCGESWPGVEPGAVFAEADESVALESFGFADEPCGSECVAATGFCSSGFALAGARLAASGPVLVGVPEGAARGGSGGVAIAVFAISFLAPV